MSAARPRLRPEVVFVVVAFVVLGLPDFAHGVAWPTMRVELRRGLGDLGWLTAVLTAGYLPGASVTGWAQRQVGWRCLIGANAFLAGGGLLLVAVGPSWPWVAAGFLVHGVGSGGLDAGINAYVALHHDRATMGFIHAGYGVGAALGPLVVRAAIVGGIEWRGAYGVLASTHVVVLALCILPLRIPADVDRPTAGPDPTGGRRRPLLGPLVFLLYGALEIGVGQWAYVALTQHRRLSATVAAVSVAVYWGGLTVGRLWLGTRGRDVDTGRLLTVASGGAILGVLVLNATSDWSAVGLPITGLSLSVVFPVLMQLTPESVGAERAATHIGWQAAAGALGGVVGSAAMAVVIDHTGIGWYGPTALVLGLLFAASLRPLTRATPRSKAIESG